MNYVSMFQFFHNLNLAFQQLKTFKKNIRRDESYVKIPFQFRSSLIHNLDGYEFTRFFIRALLNDRKSTSSNLFSKRILICQFLLPFTCWFIHAGALLSKREMKAKFYRSNFLTQMRKHEIEKKHFTFPPFPFFSNFNFLSIGCPPFNSESWEWREMEWEMGYNDINGARTNSIRSEVIERGGENLYSPYMCSFLIDL